MSKPGPRSSGRGIYSDWLTGIHDDAMGVDEELRRQTTVTPCHLP